MVSSSMFDKFYLTLHGENVGSDFFFLSSEIAYKTGLL